MVESAEDPVVSSIKFTYDHVYSIYSSLATSLGSDFDPTSKSLTIRLEHSKKEVKFILDTILEDQSEVIGWMYFPVEDPHNINYAMVVWNR